MNDVAATNEDSRGPPERRRPRCRLVGEDGNVFAIIGRVLRDLQDVGEAEAAKDFVARAFRSRSYEEVLALCAECVEVF
jgi:hypothetical protein